MKLKSVIIFSETGVSVDITSFVEEAVIYEDMGKNSLSGTITVIDGSNLPESVPLYGRESLGLSYLARSPNQTDTRLVENIIVFDIVSINDLSDLNLGTKVYTIEISSSVTIFNTTKSLNRRYQGSTSDIVSGILTDELNIEPELIEVEETDDYVSMIAPNVTPIQMINYLCNNTKNIDNKTFRFYQTNKKFYFRSLEEISYDDLTWTFSYTEKKPGNKPDVERILNYTGRRRYDLLTNLNNGMYASTVISHDIINKSLVESEYSFPISLSYREKYLPSSRRVFQHLLDNESVAGRMQRNAANNVGVMMIELYGNNMIEVGHMIGLNFPSTMNVRNKAYDSMMSGRYLINKIKHVLSQQDYHMVLEVNRND